MRAVCFYVVVFCLNEINGLQMERKPHPCPIVTRTDGHRPGHLEQLGCQRPPIGPVKEYFEMPTPRELYENHVNPYIPAVLRNALKGSPALSKWTDDQYLVDTYGDQEVLVEKKYEDRKTEPKRMVIKDFLDNYKDQNWYVVSILPNAMRQDIRVPKPLMCSSFNKNLAELNIWIGTRGTRSMLHHDADNILHCVVTGAKDWILIDRVYRDKLDMTVGREGQGSGFSHLNVDSINEDINPEVWDVPWQYTTLRSGDCLYLPHKYSHQVRSFNRTVSSTFLWYPEGEFNDDDCENVNYDDYLSLKDTYVYWTYEKGQETVDMGYMNPEHIKKEILSIFDVFQMKKIDLQTYIFFSFVQLGDDSVIEGINSILKFFADLDQDNDGYVTKEDVVNVDMEKMKDYCRGVDNPHGPTKTMLPKSDKYSHKVSEFGPREFKHRFLDSAYAKIFMEFLMRVKGENGRLTYPVFKENVQLRDGHVADAFILFDRDFDGVITTEELDNTTHKRYRDFSRMRYTLTGTRITGGGKYESELQSGNMFFLTKLDHIPEKYKISEDDETVEEVDEESILISLIHGLRKVIGNGVDKDTFLQSLTSTESSELLDGLDIFGRELMFNLLNRNDDNILTPPDIDAFLEIDTQSGLRDEFSAVGILRSIEDHIGKMKALLPVIEQFEMKRQGIDEKQVSEMPTKTEL